jgi:uncharacterized protein Usg
MSEIAERLSGSRLLTAEVLFWMPDHPGLLQSFLWQTLDVAPRYPRLARFLDHWRREVDAAIHSVRISASDDLGPPNWRTAGAAFRLN